MLLGYPDRPVLARYHAQGSASSEIVEITLAQNQTAYNLTQLYLVSKFWGHRIVLWKSSQTSGQAPGRVGVAPSKGSLMGTRILRIERIFYILNSRVVSISQKS